MFKCSRCNKISKLYEKQHKIVVAKREKFYHYHIVKVRTLKGKFKQVYTENKELYKQRGNELIKEFKSKGWEIKKEEKVCKECKENVK